MVTIPRECQPPTSGVFREDKGDKGGHTGFEERGLKMPRHNLVITSKAYPLCKIYLYLMKIARCKSELDKTIKSSVSP